MHCKGRTKGKSAFGSQMSRPHFIAQALQKQGEGEDYRGIRCIVASASEVSVAGCPCGRGRGVLRRL